MIQAMTYYLCPCTLDSLSFLPLIRVNSLGRREVEEKGKWQLSSKFRGEPIHSCRLPSIFRLFKADDTSCSSVTLNTNFSPWLKDLGRRGTCDTDGLLYCLEKSNLLVSNSAFALGLDAILTLSVTDEVKLVDCHPQMSYRRDRQKGERFFRLRNLKKETREAVFLRLVRFEFTVALLQPPSMPDCVRACTSVMHT